MFPNNFKIDEELKERATHLIYDQSKKEFILPEENYQNRMLFHNLPTGNVDETGKLNPDGKLGVVKCFYIPLEKNKALTDLFKQFKIPEELWPDLTGAYVNMFFAKCTANYSTQFERNFKGDQYQLSEALIFLSKLAGNKINITKVSLEFQDIIPNSNDESKVVFGEKKSIKFDGTMSVGLLEESLKLYEDVKLYYAFRSFGKTDEKTPAFMGHMNAEKQSQDYYCTVIFDYLRKTLFKHLFQYLEHPDIFKKEANRMRRKYSHNRLFWFIGELMILSGLVDKKESGHDQIIDSVKKRLTPYIRAGKDKLKQIKDRNKNSSDGSFEVIPFDLLF